MLAPVRVRPAMYIGSTDEAGLLHLVSELVGNSLDEHLAGVGRAISVDIADGSITVTDEGRGIAIDSIEALLTSMSPAGSQYAAGLAVVNALSERLEVEIHRDGGRWAIAYSRGKIAEPLTRLGASTDHGTTVRCRPDPQIFGTPQLELAAVAARIHELAWLTPKLHWSFQGRAVQQADGLLGLAVSVAPSPMIPGSIITVAETIEGVQLELVAGLASGARGKRVGFVNFAASNNGSHVRGVLDGITKAFEGDVAPLHRRLVLAIHVGWPHPRFEGVSRTVLQDEVVFRAVSTAVTRELRKESDLRISWLQALSAG
ncbi:MAG: hypothetical protein JNM69_42890 [Archangium sp.]|nr:hypothetical protein [Archangium sp.]